MPHMHLLTPEERAMEMGLGAHHAAERLGMTYLANINTVHEILFGCMQQTLDRGLKRIQGGAAQAWGTDVSDMAADLTKIMSGQDDHYFAIEWFSPHQLGAFILNYNDKEGAEEDGSDPDIIPWRDAIGYGCQEFLDACLFELDQAIETEEPSTAFHARMRTFVVRRTEVFLGMPAGTLRDGGAARAEEPTPPAP